MTPRLAVFDCDGTLVDGQAAVCEAMEAGFSEVGIAPPPRSTIRRIVGLSLPVAIRNLVPDADEDTCRLAVEAYRQAFFRMRSEGRVAEPLYDGIGELLTDLHGSGWTLGVATGKSDRGLKNSLLIHGLFDLFTTLQTADRHPSKPHPSMLEEAMADALARPGSTVMIGDTTYDVEMARAAGARAIGVAWGYHSPDDLMDAGAEGVANNAAELREMLR